MIVSSRKYTEKDADQLIADTDQLLEEVKAYLIAKGIDTQELVGWLTIDEYCEQFAIESPEIVHGWIDAGIVPVQNIRIVKEMSSLLLIKALPYQASQTAGS